MKVKTLKDIIKCPVCDGEEACPDLKALKEEAINWIKKLGKLKYHEHTKKYWEAQSKIDWIRHFFNISKKEARK